MCGKNLEFIFLTSLSTGSPPRVREKLRIKALISFGNGITPACAGKTLAMQAHDFYRWDHPRVCGKNFPTIISGKSLTGSPPRVREKLKDPCSSYSLLRDHPRVCGKNLHYHNILSMKAGSPPRVREKLLLFLP